MPSHSSFKVRNLETTTSRGSSSSSSLKKKMMNELLFCFAIVVSFSDVVVRCESCRSGETLKNATFGTTYDCTVNAWNDVAFVYRYPNETLEFRKAVRIHASSYNVTQSFPVMFVAKQQQSVLSWMVPTLLTTVNRLSYYFKNVSRSLCPEQTENITNGEITLEVSTMGITTAFQLTVVLEDILIACDEICNVAVSPAASRFLRYDFPRDVWSVVVKADSHDELCAVLSVQPATCPVSDMVGTVEHVGYRQTMTRRGAITVQRSTFPLDSFFIVLVVKPNDLDCDGFQRIMPLGSSLDESNRVKTFNITIVKTISGGQFLGVLFGSLGFFLCFYVVALVVGLIYYCRKKSTITVEIIEHSEIDNIIGENRVPSYGAIGPATGASDSAERRAGNSTPSSDKPASSSYFDDNSSTSDISFNDNELDLVPEVHTARDIVRTKTCLCVADLSKKPSRMLSKKYNLYVWNLITLAIFYVLPVIQLVITYQLVVNQTGDEDICYYNFNCAYSVGFLSAFNNVFSNIGYVMLGILFIVLVRRRQILHSTDSMSHDFHLQKCGIPQHFGVFYAMGIALSMEGVLSGCYHVCPSFNNFQFDTAFMYIIGWLCMLKIYQTRHPDINAHAHTAYCGIAFLVFFGVIGVTQGSTIFWIVFTLIYILCSLFLSVNIYYMGRWKIDRGSFRRVYFKIRHERLCCSKPLYVDRMVLLVIGNVVNWTFAGFGVSTMPEDFASYLLAIVIINLLMYFAFYIIMKLRCGEKVLPQPLFYIALATVVWGFALYFFMKRLTSWQMSPAMSRETNEDCLLFKFYDSHDIWHFLSAISLFLSFMVLLTLEDDLIDVPREKISVF